MYRVYTDYRKRRGNPKGRKRMLSKDNIDKLIKTGLYEKEGEQGHCRNGTYTWHEYQGKYYMLDTYWTSDRYSIELTDENFEQFKMIMDFDKVDPIDHVFFYNYAEDKRFQVGVDSGGWTYAKCFILKGTKPSREIKRLQLVDSIESAKRKIEYETRELETLDNSEYYE